MRAGDQPRCVFGPGANATRCVHLVNRTMPLSPNRTSKGEIGYVRGASHRTVLGLNSTLTSSLFLTKRVVT